MKTQKLPIPPLSATDLSPFPSVETTPLIEDLIRSKAPVAIGVSGGKDSDVAAFETQAYLQSLGHIGPVILIHSDLGRVEHKDSRPTCERLARRLGLELVVVRRKRGDLMDRWLQRWHDNLQRYRKLLCVKLILPWSTASMRFCTSELKTAIICRDLIERFPGATILSVSGIRREESTNRAKAPVCAQETKLDSKTFETQGYNWHPILSWPLEAVLRYHQSRGFPLHEAYTTYGMSRVSCAYCILAGLADLVASATNPENHEIYQEIVDHEIISSFSFQSDRWLGDVAPHLLSVEQLAGLKEAKRRAELREQVEARIPKPLLYVKGWPTAMPTQAEAVLLSEVRRNVADIMQIEIEYTDPYALLDRYAELMAIKKLRQKGQKETQTSFQHAPTQPHLWNEEVRA